MSAYSKPETPLDTVDTAIHKTNEVYVLVGKGDKQIYEMTEVVSAKIEKKSGVKGYNDKGLLKIDFGLSKKVTFEQKLE